MTVPVTRKAVAAPQAACGRKAEPGVTPQRLHPEKIITLPLQQATCGIVRRKTHFEIHIRLVASKKIGGALEDKRFGSLHVQFDDPA